MSSPTSCSPTAGPSWPPSTAAASLMVEPTSPASSSMRPAAVQLRGFRAAQLGADDRRLGIDVAELLGAQAARVGPERALDAAVAAMPADVLQASLPMLQPLAVSKATRAAVKKAQGKTFWTDLRTALAERIGAPEYELTKLQRISAGQIITVACAGFLILVLLGLAANWSEIAESFEDANWAYLPWIIGLVALHLRDRCLVPHGVCADPPPPDRDHPGDVRAGVPQPVHPGQRRGDGAAHPLPAALRHRPHPERRQHRAHQRGERRDAGAAPRGLRALGRLDRRARLQPPRHGGGRLDHRRRARARRHRVPVPVGPKLYAKLFESLRKAGGELLQLARSPMKMLELFGGAGLGKLCTITCFVLSCHAFGVTDLSYPTLAFAYMTANTVASAAPTPGGMGAIEAALLAVLTGLHVDSATALSIVIVFRLFTYWLPVIPAWFCLRLLRSRGTV